MRDLVDRYLSRGLSRRGFLRGLSRCGYSVAAAASILESLHPLLEAEAAAVESGAVPPAANVMEGSGGEILVAQLRAAGVDLVFNCNSSGTSPIFDALLDRSDMHVIQVPQEGQAIAIAQGYALASGKIGFTVHGGVGFPNTLNNMYNAWKDRTGLVVAAQRESVAVHGGRDAFEEWDDYLSPSASFTRWRWSLDAPNRIAEITRRAFTIAATPPQGPVALAFPSNVLEQRSVKAAIVSRERFMLPATVKPSPGLVEDTARVLLQAKSPLLLVGPEVTRAGAKPDVIALAERLAIPVAQGERLFDDFPTNHELFLGDYRGDLEPARGVDLILNIGARMPAQDKMIAAGTRVVHITIDPKQIGNVVPTDIGIVAGAKEAAIDLLAALESMATRDRLAGIASARRATVRAYTDRVRAQRVQAARARWNERPLSWERVGAELERTLDRNAIVVPELAEITWLGRNENAALSQLTFAPGGRSKIGRTTGSALGWGIGAAIGVQLAQPDRQVVALQGDGGFMFAQAETLWTMARHEVPIIIVVFNNRSYNGPRNKALRAGGAQGKAGREMTCYLGNPDVDFVKVAAGFGVSGETVHAPEELSPALQRATVSTRDGKPYLLDVLVARTGAGADSTWYPRFSVADARRSKV